MPIRNPEQSNKYQKEYQKGYKRKKRDNTKTYYKKKQFICFDGETENNKYTLLGSSENYVYNKDGLSSWECLNFLWNEGKGKTKIIYALHFDLQFWIKDLSDEEILDILNGVEVEYYCFKLRYFSKKFLILSKGKGKIYIYDLLPFFQKSFLKTVEEMQLSLSVKERAVIERGKRLRGKDFKNMTKKEIIIYNKTECQIAEKIADKLKDVLINSELLYKEKKFNLYPSKPYGSGAIANKIFTNLKFDEINLFVKNQPVKISEYFYKSYYGGRFEVFKIGTFDNIYKYDINSAYPYAMTKFKIPKSFRVYKPKNKNKKLTEYNFVDTNIYEIEFDFSLGDDNLLGVLPYRRKDGYVIYPMRGKGFWFGIEAKYLNELCKKTIGFFKILSELKIEYSNDLYFENGFIEEIYERRKKLKEEKNINQIAYKLGINSLYGKLAQQVGQAKFGNMLFASYITAHCRAQILEVIFTNDIIKNVIQISTDGIFVTDEIKKITTGKELGEWEKDKYKKGIILGSGIYSLIDKKSEYALRGITVSKENFENIFNKLQKSNKAEIKYKAFIGHKFALANYKKYSDFRLKFTYIKKSVNVYDYDKRFFYKKNGINKISVGLWFDFFGNKKTEYSNPLKKFEEILELEEEAITIETK